MGRRRLLGRLFWSMLGVGILAALVVSLLYDRAYNSVFRAQIAADLRAQAVLLEAAATATLAGEGDPAELQARVANLGLANDTRYTVIAPDGRVVADSAGDPKAMENHANRPEVRQALEETEASVRRYSTTVGKDLTFFARVVRAVDGAVLGIVRAARPSGAVDVAIAANRQQLFLAGLVGIVVAATVAWLLARGVAKPVAHLRDTALAMARGDDGARASLGTDDEFGELSLALNAMANRLQERVEEMRRERAKMSAIIGSMVEGVAAVDADERILHLNAAATDMLGVDAGETVGRPLIEVTRIAEICDMVTAILGSGGKASRELTIHKGSDERVVQLEAAPLRDRTGTVNGAVLVLHDVTELRRLEAVRRDFVANVSHELKTPLTAIKGMVDTMIDDPRMSSDVRERFLGKIKRQADRLASLVTDLLVLARIESSRGTEELLPLDLRQPVRESAHQLAAAAHEKGIRLEVAVPDSPVMVAGDPESLRQVVDNLLGNAIRYTPERGEVTVTVSTRTGEALLTVQDTGIGIEAQHLDRIFERFYRVDKARSRELGGTGLGLAIVKHVVLLHGGSVAVQSRPGFGSAFSVRIPLPPAKGKHRLVS